MIPMVLTIGVLDPMGADGVLADVRTFAALGVHGAAAAALVGDPAEPLAPDQVVAQVGAVFRAVRPGAVKIGALGSARLMRALADALEGCGAPVVADPSLAMRDHRTADPGLVAAWREAILPLATVATPNMAEAALLSGSPRASTLGEMRLQGEALVGLGCPHVVVSGGHGASEKAIDILVARERPALEMRGDRLERDAMRGLSGTLASAIAAHLAHGLSVFDAIQAAKLFVSTALSAAERHGAEDGPMLMHQLYRTWRRPERPRRAG